MIIRNDRHPAGLDVGPGTARVKRRTTDPIPATTLGNTVPTGPIGIIPSAEPSPWRLTQTIKRPDR